MKDLSKFLNESEEDQKKPRPLKKGEGADDREYLELISQYKEMRRYDLQSASEFFDQAQKLHQEGDVSQKAKLAAAYM